MHGRFAIQLRRDRLLHEILAFDDARQGRLDDWVAALVGRHVGEAEFVVQFLLSYIVRADVSNDLADHGRLRLLLAASGEQHCHRQRARDCSDAPSAPRHWRYVHQNSSPEYGETTHRRGTYREIVTKALADEDLSSAPPSLGLRSNLLPHLFRHKHRRMCRAVIM